MVVATLPVDVEKKRLRVLKSLAVMDTAVDQL